MDREPAKGIDGEAKRLLGEVVRSDFDKARLALSAVAVYADIPRNTLRRKLAHGDFTVAELYRLAPVLGANVLTWAAHVETRVTEYRAAEKASA